MTYKFTESLISEIPNDTIYISMDDTITGQHLGHTESRYYGHWHLGDIWINPDHLRKGLGTLLINETCSRLWSKESIPITVDAVPQGQTITQENLNKFYENAGFRATNIEKRFRRLPPV